MSLPARKLPGAARRRKEQARLRQVQRALLGLRPREPWLAPATGKPILEDVQRVIALMEKNRR